VIDNLLTVSTAELRERRRRRINSMRSEIVIDDRSIDLTDNGAGLDWREATLRHGSGQPLLRAFRLRRPQAVPT
jgi:hypothetical protein